MTGLQKILQEIQDEASAEAAAVISKATAQADDIISAAKAEGLAKAGSIAEGAKRDVININNARESELVLQRRQRMLKVKQDLLAETLQKALDTLYELDDKEYFALIIRLAAKNAAPGQGEMMLNNKDLARKPADFEKELSKALPSGSQLALSGKTLPIDGGFVLSYGGVEQNCSFKDIFAARREDFNDMIRDILFV